MLPGPFVTCSGRVSVTFSLSKRGVVRVKGYDRFLSCLAFGKRNFPRVFFNGSLFHQVLPFLFRGGWLWIRQSRRIDV